MGLRADPGTFPSTLVIPFRTRKAHYKQKHEREKNVSRTLFWILLYFFNEGLSYITKSRN